MDDLKQSVNNAVYEQKDPLLIYKFEALKLFKTFIQKVNEDVVTFLLKANIYAEEQQPIQQQRAPRPEPKPVLRESRAPEPAMAGEMGGYEEDGPPIPKAQPVKAEKIANRNERVTVRYYNGELKRDVKYKTVEEDILASRCVVVDM